MSGDKINEAIEYVRQNWWGGGQSDVIFDLAKSGRALADEVERLRQSVLRLEHELDEAQETIARYVDEETKGGAT